MFALSAELPPSQISPRIIDVTWPLEPGTTMFPDDPPFRSTVEKHLTRGDAYTATTLRMGSHSGTHLDAPAHFVSSGATVDGILLARMIGPARVVDIPAAGAIGPDAISDDLPVQTHLLFKTANRALPMTGPYRAPHAWFTVAAAERLASVNPASIGFDHYSLDAPDAPGFPVQVVLARAGIPVVVCLNLHDVLEGDYLYAALPLNIVGAEAAPVRAVLMTGPSPMSSFVS